jgi:predicted kinase/aminoglycoside phosphotransferase
MRIQVAPFSLIVLIGPSSAGKSSFARRHFLATEVVSSDRCRALICDDENNQDVSQEAFALLHTIVARRLENRRLTVVDATSLLPRFRRPLIDLARRHGADLYAIVFDLPAEVCLERHSRRTSRPFSPEVILRQVADLNENLDSLETEGFDRVWRLSSPEMVRAASMERTGRPGPGRRTGWLLPRALHVTADLPREELAPPSPADLPEALPGPVAAVTGPVRVGGAPGGGCCSLVRTLEGPRGRFVLKVARGAYRSAELWAEHAAMRRLADGPVPVPRSLAFARQGALAYQVREFVPGQPVSEVLAGSERDQALRTMGRTLAAIHSVTLPGWTWTAWLEGALLRAEANLRTGVLDLAEEFADETPEAALRWLLENRPAPGAVALLHADYRPKNLLWAGGRVVSVLDWAFADFGDPYYDLAIALECAERPADREGFLEAYGLAEPDAHRLAYCARLAKFINV